jgi:prephenate dehydrogenase
MNFGTRPDNRPIETIAVVGLGLIGGSVALAARRRQLAHRIIGVGRDALRLQGAVEGQIIDQACTDIRQAALQAELMVFCTPVQCIVEGVQIAAGSARPGTLLTDAGSVKGSICSALGGGWSNGTVFVGAHPLAGSEKQGYEHADAALFEGRVCVLTPHPLTPRLMVDRVAGFWRGLGAWVLEMAADAHDRALAQTSHLPHVVASALAATLTPAHYRLAATGFCDTTRVAEGDPTLWSQILIENAQHVLDCLGQMERNLAGFRAALQAGDQLRLEGLLAQGRQVRQDWRESITEAQD